VSRLEFRGRITRNYPPIKQFTLRFAPGFVPTPIRFRVLSVGTYGQPENVDTNGIIT
jgi:hypothetical protein